MVDELGGSMNERQDNVLKTDYARSSEFYRHGRASAAEGGESSAKGDLSRLRQSLGPEPEVVHIPQPTRRLGWFVSGFIIASVLGVVIGVLVIVGFPSLLGKAPASGPNTAESTSKSDNSKLPQEANAPAAALAIAPTGPRVTQSGSPSPSVPAAPAAAQPAKARQRISRPLAGQTSPPRPFAA